jgi:anti-anti-sigma factor
MVMEKNGGKKEFSMEVFIEQTQDKARFTIHGEIDTRSGLELSEKFQALIENEGILVIELNMEDVHNITSAGIGKILKLLKYLNSRGGTITIKGISPSLRQLFREIHLDKIIPIEDR